MENQNLVVKNENASLITLNESTGKEILRLQPNGDIYVNGELCEDDKAIADALRTFAKTMGNTLNK